MDRSDLAIVIPAFNEEATVHRVVSELVTYGTVIVVDDGSSDQTAIVAREAGALVVSHGINLGYDAALNSGFENALTLKCNFVITFDADGQHSATLVDPFLEALCDGYDVVIGVRSKRARTSEKIFGWVTDRLWGIKDPMCGMKGYRMEVYESLGHFDSYGSIGSELCVYAAKKGFRIAQIAFNVNLRGDKPRLGTIISANAKIFRALLLSLFIKISV